VPTYIEGREFANGRVRNYLQNREYQQHIYIMNTRQTTRHQEDKEISLRRRDVNDEEYDPHWRVRLLPGNQEIYERESIQSRRRHKEYCESTAREVARRYASRGAPGPRFHRPQGRVTRPSPRECDTRPVGTPHPGGARRLTVTGLNLLVERARILRLTQGPNVSPPTCRSPTGDSVTVSPPRPMIQARRHLPAPVSPVHQHRPTQADTNMDKSTNTGPIPASQCDAARTLEPYLDRVTRVLERLELLVQRPPPVAMPPSRPRIPTPVQLRQRSVARYMAPTCDEPASRTSPP